MFFYIECWPELFEIFVYTLAGYLLSDLPGSGYSDLVFSLSSFSSADSGNWVSN